MNEIRTIHSVDAPAGSGKTYNAIQYALTQAAAHQRKTVMVFKSIELLKQAQRDAFQMQDRKPQQIPIKAIHSDSIEALATDYSVSSAIAEHLADVHHGIGEILMITDAAYYNVMHWPNRWMWICIFDEIPAVAPAHKLNIPDNHRLLTDHLYLGPDKDGYSQVFPTDDGKAALLRYAENSNRDEINAVLSKLAGHIVSPCFDTHVKTQHYERVCSGNGERGARQINMFSLMQPNVFGSGKPRGYREQIGSFGEVIDAFAEVILMGAGFNDSILGLIWPQHDLEILPHKEISDGLRYDKHSCGPRLKIQYLFETDWSKAFRDRNSVRNGVDQSNFSILVDAIADEFQGKEFLFLVNKDVEKHAKAKFEPIDGKQLPNAPWGLNRFQHVHKAGVLSALNPTPAHVKFFDHMGLDGNAVREALYHSQVYQAVMRSSLRNLQATQDVQIILPDRNCAFALGQMFPGRIVEKLDRQIIEAEPKASGRPKSKTPKPHALSQHETRQRKQSINKEIKRIEAGGAVDEQFVDQLGKVRSDNQHLIRLLEVIEENR